MTSRAVSAEVLGDRDRAVIVELRDYHVFTGKLPELVRLYETEGTAIQQAILGNAQRSAIEMPKTTCHLA